MLSISQAVELHSISVWCPAWRIGPASALESSQEAANRLKTLYPCETLRDFYCLLTTGGLISVRGQLIPHSHFPICSGPVDCLDLGFN